MANKKTVKCRFSHCLHESKEIDREDAVKSGNAYYHRNCYETKEQIKKIIDLFASTINPNVVYTQLVKVVNTIIFEKGISSDLLLFGLQYYIDNKIQLNYPGGLYYVIQNKKMLQAYSESRKPKIPKDSFEIKEENDLCFTHIKAKTCGFGDILK